MDPDQSGNPGLAQRQAMTEPGRSGSGYLYLVRHGQGSLGTDDYDRLSCLGQRQSLLLGERLQTELDRPFCAWTGSLRRHRQTLDGLRLVGDELIEPALNEYTVDALIRSAVDQAESLGLQLPDSRAFSEPVRYLATFLEWFPEVLSVWQQGRLDCIHNGSWHAFQSRVLSPVAQWHRQLSAGGSAVVVTSAGVISTIVADLLDEDLVWQRELNVCLYNASVTRLSLNTHGGWQAGPINCIDHLVRPELQTLA